MARIRTIKPEFWEDEKIGLLSHGARLLFLGCLNLADDEGILRWNEMFLSSSIFTYDEIKQETIAKWMQELIEHELAFPYNGGIAKQKLGLIVNFHKHQRIDKPQPSKFPPPSIQNRDVKLMYAKRDGFICQICHGQIDLQDEKQISGSLSLSLDHIQHRINGGEDHPSNIRATHLGCNKSRKDRPDGEFSTGNQKVKMELNKLYKDSKNDSLNSSKNHSPQEGKGKEGIGKDVEEADNKFFEMFRRVAGKHIKDEELNTEVAKFINKYPNLHPNQAGALINTWVGNIGKIKNKEESNGFDAEAYKKQRKKEEAEQRKNY